ncbi:transmembrane channel-like protein 5 isoform X2 [Mugil cephalus]|uniref:transmembrane channel-like protein 5 isoform X2 n=1 Tax=Mugil cephalus TaxID=48193 RepID=UPI001FB7533B|nr:transmembrane channel-like protein 5 isoform X2 [Mugil cephalus]
MTSYRDGGFFNHGYHDDETLEIDRAPSKSRHTNPYAEEDPGWWGQRDLTSEANSGDAFELAPRGGWQYESRRGTEIIQMDTVPERPETHSSYAPSHTMPQTEREYQYGQSPPARRPPSVSDYMSLRWRGMTMKRMSMRPEEGPANAAVIEDVYQKEVEDVTENLIKELVALSTQDRIRAMRDLTMSFQGRKHIRSQVLESSKKSRDFTYFTEYSEIVSLSLRRFGYSVRSARQTLELWHGTLKEIGGKFGTSVRSYFVFLRWLLMFNIFTFLVNFSLITIPMLVYDHTPNVPPNVTFTGLELLTGAGYFGYTVMYYGAYSNETLQGPVKYDLQLAYFFTIAVYMVLCGIALIYSMASSFRKNYILADPASNSAWQLLCSWDFSVTNERAVRQRRNNLSVQLKESLSEKYQKVMLTTAKRVELYGVRLGCWFVSTALAVGCACSIYYLSEHILESTQLENAPSCSLRLEAETLLVPFVVSLMNMVIPLFYSIFNHVEQYSNQRIQIYALVARNVLLRLFILAVLCYSWMDVVAESCQCWESLVGQALYRLVIFDFIFLMLGSFFGEFLGNLIGSKFLPQLGVPEFDVARNVLDLIYAQSLAWIGIYFSPLLPVIQILKFFILFYLKKFSLILNCQPPKRSSRAAQMQTIFIFLLFFPFFVGALSIVGYTAWTLRPSEQCGPFRGLNNTFSVVGVWINDLDEISSSRSTVWVYEYVIRSEIFYFIITLIILVIIYMFWQVIQGRRELIVLLRQQIINAGKDKSFLLERLQKDQKTLGTKQSIQSGHKKPPSDNFSGGQYNSNAKFQTSLARQPLEEEEDGRSIGEVPAASDTSSAVMMDLQRADSENQDSYQEPDEDFSPPSAFALAMAARKSAESQERDEYDHAGGVNENRSAAFAQAMQARQRAEDREEDTDDPPNPVSSVMMQVMQARQRAEEEEEEEDRMPWVNAPPYNPSLSGSSALIQAMWARQQAQNEYDDGY